MIRSTWTHPASPKRAILASIRWAAILQLRDPGAGSRPPFVGAMAMSGCGNEAFPAGVYRVVELGASPH